MIEFLEHGGMRAVITDPANVERALAGETGTTIVRVSGYGRPVSSAGAGRRPGHPQARSPRRLAASSTSRSSSLVHDDDPVVEREDLVEVLADQQHCRAARRRVEQVPVHGLDGAERRGRASARRRRAPSSRPRTRARSRASGGCRPRGCSACVVGPERLDVVGAGSPARRRRASAAAAGTARASRSGTTRSSRFIAIERFGETPVPSRSSGT